MRGEVSHIMQCLEIGPGKDRIGPEWVTLDCVKRPNVDHVHDIEQRMPFPDGSFDLIYASHILEHVDWRKTVAVLKDLRRILRFGGSLEVWVPDARKIIRCAIQGFIPVEEKWRESNPDNDPWTRMQGRVFAYSKPDQQNWHRAAFSAEHLEKCLRRAEFSEIKPLTTPRAENHGWINLGIKGVK